MTELFLRAVDSMPVIITQSNVASTRRYRTWSDNSTFRRRTLRWERSLLFSTDFWDVQFCMIVSGCERTYTVRVLKLYVYTRTHTLVKAWIHFNITLEINKRFDRENSAFPTIKHAVCVECISTQESWKICLTHVCGVTLCVHIDTTRMTGCASARWESNLRPLQCSG